jgi:hypothetical protein
MTVMGIFLALVFLLEYMSPHRFSWKPTFDRNDREPFGSYVFDDVVSSSVEDYTVTDLTFYRILQDDSAASRPRAFLLTENYFQFNDTDIKSLYKLIRRGNQVMICTDHFPYALEDTLCFKTGYDNYFPSIERYIRGGLKRDSLFFGTDTLHPEQVYEVYPPMHPVYLVEGKEKWIYDRDSVSIRNGTTPVTDEAEMTADGPDTAVTEEDETAGNSYFRFFPVNCDSMEVPVWNNKNRPLVIRLFIGKGELFLVSTPLMFTNYGMLDGDNASYVFRLLSCMKGKPLTRIEAYGRHGEKARTPLRYVLSEPPLKWAVYSMFILLILFMAFTARRRQRVIPAVKAPPNRAFGFMQLISNLYYQKHENGEILKMKHLYFCAGVKRLTGTDLQEGIPDETVYTRLSEKAGMDKETLRTLIKNINMAIYRSEVPDMQLKEYIDGMNNLLHALKS